MNPCATLSDLIITPFNTTTHKTPRTVWGVTRLLIWLSMGAGSFGCSTDTSTVAQTDENPVTFEDVSGSLPLPEEYGDYGVFWADFDHDDQADLVFMGHGQLPLMLHQQKDGSFEDVSPMNGLRRDNWEYPQQRDRHGASCADMNKDGELDLFITHGAQRGETLGIKYDELLTGNGDLTFNDVSRSAGSLNTNGRGRHGIWADIDNDGWLDLYVANFQSPNAMYRNNGNGSFTDITASSGLGIAAFRAAWSDFDQDDDIDVLLASPLRLMRNDGNGVFEDVTSQMLGRANRFAYGIVWSDLDSDGDQDIVFSALDLPVQVYINHGHRFDYFPNTPFAAPPGVRTTGIAPADIDNDGDIDLVANTSTGIQVHRNIGSSRYRMTTFAHRPISQAQYTHADIAMADFDNDGLLDFATDDPAGYRLFRNTSTSSGHWLRIKFEGRDSDTYGFGNKVWITVSDELIAYREYHGAVAGLRSFGCSALQIGLGDHDRVNVTVRWPNGQENHLVDVPVNRVVHITQ